MINLVQVLKVFFDVQTGKAKIGLDDYTLEGEAKAAMIEIETDFTIRIFGYEIAIKVGRSMGSIGRE